MIITTETQVFYLNRIIIIATVKELFGLFRESHFSNRNLSYGIKKKYRISKHLIVRATLHVFCNHVFLLLGFSPMGFSMPP